MVFYKKCFNESQQEDLRRNQEELGGAQEEPRRRPGGAQEEPRRSPGGAQEEPRRSKGGCKDFPELMLAIKNRYQNPPKMQELAL